MRFNQNNELDPFRATCQVWMLRGLLNPPTASKGVTKIALMLRPVVYKVDPSVLGNTTFP